ncbi:hypothetical protein TNCV_1575221 [Trichonephila clavipes]|nr:hypothetical protein TNCV_1575221 [Trichonephila clavipes]
MIRLTSSASTIEPPIFTNTLTSKSVGFPLWFAIVRLSVVNSSIPPIFLPIPVWELITRAMGCVSEFLTRILLLLLETFPRTYQLFVEG